MKKYALLIFTLLIYNCTETNNQYRERDALLQKVYKQDQTLRLQADMVPDLSARYKSLWDTIPIIDE